MAEVAAQAGVAKGGYAATCCAGFPCVHVTDYYVGVTAEIFLFRDPRGWDGAATIPWVRRLIERLCTVDSDSSSSEYEHPPKFRIP